MDSEKEDYLKDFVLFARYENFVFDGAHPRCRIYSDSTLTGNRMEWFAFVQFVEIGYNGTIGLDNGRVIRHWGHFNMLHPESSIVDIMKNGRKIPDFSKWDAKNG